jgi:serine protease Do
VTPDSPAARAGIEVGDVILTFNDREVTEMKDLPKLVADAAPGEKTSVTVWRQGRKRSLKVSVARSPEVTADAGELATEPVAGPRLGLALVPMTEALRQRYDIGEDIHGALVVETESGSAAAQEDIRPGDVIVQAGGKPVSTPADVINIVRESSASHRDSVLLLVNRQGSQRFVTVQLS